MMGRDDIPVGVGGEGGITPEGNILPDVGGYLPIIEQVHGKPMEKNRFFNRDNAAGR